MPADTVEPPPSFFEVAAGVMVPLGDDTYEAYTDDSFKLALRVGLAIARHVVLELDGDWTPAAAKDTAIIDVSANRFRVLAGLRLEKAFAKHALIFARLGVGTDIVTAKATGTVFGVDFERKDSDVGLALEVGGGIAFTSGAFAVGGQLAIPIGMHFNDDDPNDNSDFNYEYTATDLDFLGFVQTRF